MSRTRAHLLSISLATAVITLTGCGQQAAETTTPSTTQDTTPSSSSSTTTSPSAHARFPLTVSRLGGVAGFNDSATIQADGSVVATTRQGKVSCTLDEVSLTALDEGAAPIGDSDQPDPSASTPADHLEVLIGSGSGLASTSDPRVAKATPIVTQLLADLNGPVANRRICT